MTSCDRRRALLRLSAAFGALPLLFAAGRAAAQGASGGDATSEVLRSRGAPTGRVAGGTRGDSRARTGQRRSQGGSTSADGAFAAGGAATPGTGPGGQTAR